MRRWVRGLFPAVILVAGTVVYWTHVTQKHAQTADTLRDEKRPTVVGLPAVRVQPTPARQEPVTGAVSPGAEKAALSQTLDQDLIVVGELAPEDQEGLDRLFDDARQAISGHEKEYVAYFRAKMKGVEKMPLKSSFFLVKALVDNVSDPAPPLRDLLLQKQPKDPNEDPHHSMPRTNLVKTFAIEQWMATPNASDDARLMAPVLRKLAARDPDLSVAREAAIAVIKANLVADPAGFIRQVRRVRGPNEQFAFEDLK